MTMSVLSLVIPYRDRKEHISVFIPRICDFLSSSKILDQSLVRLVVVEQEDNFPFNRGTLLNIGFHLERPFSDLFVFHDVDYVPLDADYSPVSCPTRLIWHGLSLKESYSDFFGAVCMVPGSLFEKVNGYANGYWGWGFEDTDLKERFSRHGIPIGRRDGKYEALQHKHNGLTPSGLSPAAVRNRNRYLERMCLESDEFTADGLSSLRFRLSESKNFTIQNFQNVSLYWHKCTLSDPGSGF